MIVFDLLLILFVSAMLALKSLYLGAIVLTAGVLIGFQNQRTHRLLGVSVQATSVARKIKAAILALLLGLCVMPFVFERPLVLEASAKAWSEEAALPVMILIGLFAASMLAALTVEKRKR